MFAKVDRSGDTVVSLDWSARGNEEPAAERFDLAFPPAAVASLDRDVPATRVWWLLAAKRLRGLAENGGKKAPVSKR